jgi:mycothiol synthase
MDILVRVSNAVVWRSATTDDDGKLAALFTAVNRVAPIGLEMSPADVHARLTRPGLDLDADTQIAVDSAGKLVAYAEAADMGIGQGMARIRLTTVTQPGRDDDLASALHDWSIHRAKQISRGRHPDLPAMLGTRCAAADRARLDQLTGSGFKVVHWEHDLTRPTVPPPAVAIPDSITVLPYQARYDEATRIAHNQAYADSPGALLPDAQSWPQHAVGLPSFFPDASFIAVTADPTGDPDIVAFLFSLRRPSIDGSSEAFVDCVGTRQPSRRRGLATILIDRAVAAYRHAGLDRARLQVRSTNTDAIRVYTRLGFTDSGRGYAILQAPLTITNQ